MSRLELSTARSGDATALIDSRQIHSRVDPAREARRYLQTNPPPPAETLIVLAPGLGYLVRALREERPAARIIALFLLEECADATVARADDGWSPSRGPLDAFLDRAIGDLAVASIALVEWPPVCEALPESAAGVRDGVLVFLRRARASLVTQGRSGRRWFRNRVHGYLHIRPLVSDGTRRVRAVVVAGSGPSLEESLPTLRAAPSGVEIWATGSALEALLDADVVPSLVFVTDAAPYALEHIRAILGRTRLAIPVAAPLSAARGLASGCDAGVLVLTEGSPLERRLLAALGTEAPFVPPHGTVTASAAQLARVLTTAPIVFAGADFAWHQGRSHARPHLAHAYVGADSFRLRPQHGAPTGHTPVDDGWTTDATLSTYAAWFTTNAYRRFAPVAALAPSPALRGIPRIHAHDLARLPLTHKLPRWVRSDSRPGADRTEQCAVALDSLETLVRSFPEPASIHDVESAPDVVSVAIELAFAALLEWKRGASWSVVVTRVCDEIASARETIR